MTEKIRKLKEPAITHGVVAIIAFILGGVVVSPVYLGEATLLMPTDQNFTVRYVQSNPNENIYGWVLLEREDNSFFGKMVLFSGYIPASVGDKVSCRDQELIVNNVSTKRRC